MSKTLIKVTMFIVCWNDPGLTPSSLSECQLKMSGKYRWLLQCHV